ncbi:hypothetical protein [Arthrobacter sp. N199823]|uniref:hypothetical protein n=1 Tax=Arthrobacter sp. N199823 TaxID=2058895 RepID=UPI000CE2C4AC|nr:hypothetical protein [Arthrobacter sp. N199823]
MAQAKKRTVRFFTPRIVDSKGNSTLVSDDFWGKFIDFIAARSRSDREAHRNGHALLGLGGTHNRTNSKYLYIGKMRAKGDYPDDFDPQGSSPTSLAFNATIREISEPAYVIPTGIKKTVAILRTTGGPRLEDIEYWISSIGLYIGNGQSFVLDPVLNTKQWDLLKQAQLVSKVEVKVAKDQVPSGKAKGKVNKAVREVMAIGDFDTSFDFTLSFGHGVPNTVAGSHFTDEMKDYIENGEYSKAVASLKIPNPDGTWRTESVNFIREVVTYQARVGQTDSDPLTPDLILPEVLGAIASCRGFLKQ